MAKREEKITYCWKAFDGTEFPTYDEAVSYENNFINMHTDIKINDTVYFSRDGNIYTSKVKNIFINKEKKLLYEVYLGENCTYNTQYAFLKIEDLFEYLKTKVIKVDI